MVTIRRPWFQSVTSFICSSKKILPFIRVWVRGRARVLARISVRVWVWVPVTVKVWVWVWVQVTVKVWVWVHVTVKVWV